MRAMEFIVKATGLDGGNELEWTFKVRRDAERKIRELKDQRSITNNFVITFQEKQLITA